MRENIFKKKYTAVPLVVALALASGCADDGPGDEPDAGTPPTVTLVGTVSVDNAEVQARVGAATIASTTADAAGAYRLDIAVTDTDVVHLHAASGDAVVLTSMLADGATLIARAGPDMELHPEEYNASNINPVTTMRDAVLRAANGGDLPASGDELVAAEHLITSKVTGDELLEMAAALELVISSPSHDLPAAFTDTLALAGDIQAMRQLIVDIRAASPTDELRSTLNAMMENPGVVGAYAMDKLPSAYYIDFIKYNNGFIGLGNTALELDVGGTARLLTNDLNRVIQALPEFSWSLGPAPDSDKLITERESTGFFTESDNLDGEQLAALFPEDPALQNQIRTAVGDSLLPIGSELLGAERVLAAEGVAVDVVWETGNRYWLVAGPLSNFGVTAPDVEALAPGVGVTMFRADQMQFQPLDDATMVGTWAMQIAAPANLDSLVALFAVGDQLLRTSLVTFAADNTASAVGGVLDSPLSLTWEIRADGSLALTYPDGASQVSSLWAREGAEYGLLNRYVAPTGETNLYYGRSIKTDPTFMVTGPELPNQPGQFWKTSMVAAEYLPDANGELPIESEFGFHIRDDTTAAKTFLWKPLDQPTEVDSHDFYNWRVDNGDVVLDWWADENRQPRCDPAASNCYVHRERTWTPLAQEGPLLYVLEQILTQKQYFALQWDDVDMQWEDGTGAPADLSARDYLFPPRLNAYRVVDIPTP